ncbi:hypothetical protein BKI52_08450 [marine bacterium AO1-C]|nr:hypothetical protein BKI52_08450 [marine bacterium AO1-C]
MHKLLLMAGAIFSGLSVALGAFGAHALKALLEKNQRVDVFETAVRYQFFHALALILLGILAQQMPHKYLNNAGYAFIIGIIIFSGSLYILAITNIRWLGAITPIGGVAFIVGWVLMLLAVMGSKG